MSIAAIGRSGVSKWLRLESANMNRLTNIALVVGMSVAVVGCGGGGSAVTKDGGADAVATAGTGGIRGSGGVVAGGSGGSVTGTGGVVAGGSGGSVTGTGGVAGGTGGRETGSGGAGTGGAAGAGAGTGGRSTGGAPGSGGNAGGTGGLGMTCVPSDPACSDGVLCGGICCPPHHYCQETPGPPTCRCGNGPACTAPDNCYANLVYPNQCGSICCSGNACPISRRAAKRDIRAVSRDDLDALYDQLRHIQLSTYQYKDQPPSTPRRLGFIIDDTQAPAAINPDGNSVDLYGYLSMAVAAVQIQARQIEDLKARIRALESTPRSRPAR
jgi:hypothetical protein